MKMMFPKTRLAELVARSGGMWREEAIAQAQLGVESLREECIGAIDEAIASIETILSAATNNRLAPQDLEAVLRHSDRIVTLAGTFGLDKLDRVVRSLCDLAAGFIASGIQAAEPIAVHVQALRMFAPKATPLAEADSDRILGELAKILSYFDFTRAPLPHTDEDSGEYALPAA